MFQEHKEFFSMIWQLFRTATRLSWFALGVAALIGFCYFRIFFRKRECLDEHPTTDWNHGEHQWAKTKGTALVLIVFVSYWLARSKLSAWFPSFFGSE